MKREIKNINNQKIKLSTIKGFNLVNLIYQNGSKVHSDNISMVYISMEKLGKIYNFELANKYVANHYNNIESTIHLYFATIVSKKNNKKAVCRNRIKRLLREGLVDSLKNKEQTEIYNDMFILFTSRHKIKRQSEINLNDILSDFKILFEKLDKKLIKQIDK